MNCDTCGGARYDRETLDLYRGKSIADVLSMPISEAQEFFAAQPAIARYLQSLADVGLGYIASASLPHLVWGRGQRVKLATELARRATGHTF